MAWGVPDEFAEAVCLMKADNPQCIELFEKIGTDPARARLSWIYLKGKCGQEKDFERALSYTKDNSSLMALEVECKIIIFIYKQYDRAEIYINRLKEALVCSPTNTHMKEMLAKFYFMGIGTPCSFSKALELNPNYINPKDFYMAFKRLDESQQKNLKNDILTSSVPEYKLTLEKCERELDTLNKRKQIENTIETYKKAKDHAGLNKYVTDLFSENPTIDNAYYYLEYCTNLSKSLFYKAADFLNKDESNYWRNVTVLSAAETLEEWPYLKYWVDKLRDSGNNYQYFEGRLNEHNNNLRLAREQYLNSFEKNPETGKYNKISIRAAKRLYGLDPKNCIYYPQCAEALLQIRIHETTYAVAIAWHQYGNDQQKQNALVLLKKIAQGYRPAAEKYYEITGDDQYLNQPTKTHARINNENCYHYNPSDSTETIESNYSSLTPRVKIIALKKIISRYKTGEEDVEKDLLKAANYLQEIIQISKDIGISASYDKAALALIVFNEKYPILDDSTVFEYLSLCKDNTIFNLALAECYLNGIGTPMDAKKALECLNKELSDDRLRKTIKILQNRSYVPYDKNEIYKKIRLYLTLFEPTTKIVSAYHEILKKDPDYNHELSYEEYNAVKIFSLLKKAHKADDPYLKIKYLDCARKLGSRVAVSQEANTIQFFFQEYKLAYSLLKVSGIDEADRVYRRIKETDCIMVDINTGLKDIFDRKTKISNSNWIPKEIKLKMGDLPFSAEDLITVVLVCKKANDYGKNDVYVVSKKAHYLLEIKSGKTYVRGDEIDLKQIKINDFIGNVNPIPELMRDSYQALIKYGLK